MKWLYLCRFGIHSRKEVTKKLAVKCRDEFCDRVHVQTGLACQNPKCDAVALRSLYERDANLSLGVSILTTDEALRFTQEVARVVAT